MLTRTVAYTCALIGSLTFLIAVNLATNTASAAPITVTPMATVAPSMPEPVTAAQTPSAPTTAAQAAALPKAPSVVEPVIGVPANLSIPSITLDAPVVPVGLNAKGEMDVPNGNSNDVGWYKNGTMPGSEGSAVLDAHVFAALKNLRYAAVGDSVYIKDVNGVTRRFVIRSSMVYALADVPRELLFNRTGGEYLNIITCAGAFDPSINTYDHRLIVYAELVNN